MGNLCTETPQVTVEGEESSSDSSSSSSSSSSAEEDDHSASASSSAAAATKVKKKKNSRKTGSKKGGRRKKRVCLSESHVSSHRSAIKWWHAENKMPLPPDFESEIKQLMVGYKKKIAGLKQSGKMPQQEGKVALKFDAYKCLCEKLMKLMPTLSAPTTTSTGKSHVSSRFNWQSATSGWCYLILIWNLISRAATVGTIHQEHLDFEADHMWIYIGASKCDPTAEKSADWR